MPPFAATRNGKGPRLLSAHADASSASQFHVQSDRHSIRSLAESSAAWDLLTSVAPQLSNGLALGAGLESSKNRLRARAGIGIVENA